MLTMISNSAALDVPIVSVIIYRKPSNNSPGKKRSNAPLQSLVHENCPRKPAPGVCLLLCWFVISRRELLRQMGSKVRGRYSRLNQELNQPGVSVWLLQCYLAVYLNFCPASTASNIRPPLATVKVAIPLW